MNGVTITREEFAKLPNQQKYLVMFDNLEYIKIHVTRQTLHRKIHYAWLSGITAVIAYLLNIRLF